MKFIFDFDDVLFHAKDFKKRMYTCLNNVGVSFNRAEEYYQKVRGGEFSLKNYISELLKIEKVDTITIEDVYENIMRECPNFINKELVSIVKELGKTNCYLVTYGEYEFNKAKVERSGLAPLFCEIKIVSGSKKEIIYDICGRNKDEKIIFIDDKIQFFEDLDLKKCPNLKTILYDEQSLEKFKAEITNLQNLR